MSNGTFCGSCGSVLKEGALYCGSCGAAAPQGRAAPAVPPPTMVGTVGGSWPAPDRPYASAVMPAVQTYAGAPDDPVPTATARPGGIPVGGSLPSDPGLYATFGRRVAAYIIDAIPPLLIVILSYGALLAAVLGRSSGGASFSLVLSLVLPVAYFVLLWAMAAKGSSPGKALLGMRVVRENTGAFPGAGLGLGRLLLMGLLIGITFYIGGFSPLWDKTGRRKGWWDQAVGTVVLNLSAVQGYRSAVGNHARSSGAAVEMTAPQPVPVDPTSAVAGVLESAGALDVPEWDLPPVRPATNATKAPAATWGDRPADSAPATHTISSPVRPSPVGGPVPSPMTSVEEVPWGAPAAPAGVIKSIPGLSPVATEDSLEHTRMAPPRTPQPSTGDWQLTFDDGRNVPLTESLIVGRDPVVAAGEPDANLLALGDEGRSVSKTHLRLDAGPAGVQVTDRHSTNGVTVITAGIPLACVPGVATLVPDNSTVRFGDRHLLVRRV
jgi:uncharacterized RDD family membrane protein YckC